MLEKRPLFRNDGLNKIEKIIHRSNKRRSVSCRNFANRYRDGKLSIILPFTVAGSGQHYASLFQREDAVRDKILFVHHRSDGKPEVRKVIATPRKIVGDVAKGRRNDGPVLVDIVKFVEVPKGPIPSSVWLGFADDIFSLLADARYWSARFRES